MWPYSNEERDWLNAASATPCPPTDRPDFDFDDVARLTRQAHVLRARAFADGLAGAGRAIRAAAGRVGHGLAWVLYPAYREGGPR